MNFLKYIFLSLILFTFTISSYASQSTGSTGNHEKDLAHIYGAILSIKHTVEICNDRFPNLAPQNNDAYQDWSANYKPFLQEIDKYISQLQIKHADNNHEKYLKLRNKYESRLKQSLAHKMNKSGTDKFIRKCKAIPSFLASKQANFEHSFAEKIPLIRSNMK